MTFEIYPAGKSGKVKILNTVSMTFGKAIHPMNVPSTIGGLTFRQEIFWLRLANQTVSKGRCLTIDEIESVRLEVGMRA